MIQVLLLAGWALSGVAVAALLAPENRLHWAPMALIFGPLWAAVTLEQRDGAHRASVPGPVSTPAPAPEPTLPPPVQAPVRVQAGMVR